VVVDSSFAGWKRIAAAIESTKNAPIMVREKSKPPNAMGKSIVGSNCSSGDATRVRLEEEAIIKMECISKVDRINIIWTLLIKVKDV
jgi:hypothetical protein